LVHNRGVNRVRCGRFEEADEDFAKAIVLDPTNHWSWYFRGCLLAYLGKTQQHRELSQAMLARFSNDSVRYIRERTAKTCLLIPGAVQDPAPLLKILDEVVKSGQPYLPWFQMGKGMGEYRMARYAAAIESVTTAEPNLQSRQGEVTCALFRAMALHKMGKAAEARAAFDRAIQSLQRGDQTPGVDDLGYDGVENWLICHIALREAQQTLGINPPATGPARDLATRPATNPY
jgi:tetratricopeptide (TPR) repeat protein